jgi:hypothetical protein
LNEVLTKLQTHADAFGELKDFSFEHNDFLEQEKALRDSWSAFIERLHQRIGEQDTNEKLSVFIKLIQDRLTDFSDQVFEYYKGVEVSSTSLQMRKKELFNHIENEVIKILKFLKINFSSSFNYYGKVPYWLFYSDKELFERNNQIICGLHNKDINNHLILILQEFLSSSLQSVTDRAKNWHQYVYHKNIASALSDFVESPYTEDDTIRLIKLLIGYNFNSLSFYEFMLEFASDFVDKKMSYEEQELALLKLLKIIENIRPEVKEGYKPEVQPILESVSGSLRRELEIIAKMKEINCPDLLNGTERKGSLFYFEVASTLEELFFLIKVMLAVRFIRTRYNANLYRFVERHIKTDRTKTASTQYMRNILAPSWRFSSKVIRKVRSWLSAMINYIDTHFLEELKILFVIWFLKEPIILELLVV